MMERTPFVSIWLVRVHWIEGSEGDSLLELGVSVVFVRRATRLKAVSGVSAATCAAATCAAAAAAASGLLVAWLLVSLHISSVLVRFVPGLVIPFICCNWAWLKRFRASLLIPVSVAAATTAASPAHFILVLVLVVPLIGRVSCCTFSKLRRFVRNCLKVQIYIYKLNIILTFGTVVSPSNPSTIHPYRPTPVAPILSLFIRSTMLKFFSF